MLGSIVGQPRERYLAELDRRLVHFHYLSQVDWQQMCGRQGLTVDTAEGYISPSETRRWETLSRMTGGLLHSLSFGRRRPIEIQRALRLRQFQNSTRFPRSIASAIAKAISLGVDQDGDEGIPSCLLVTGHR
jgi:hypothetical protein